MFVSAGLFFPFFKGVQITDRRMHFYMYYLDIFMPERRKAESKSCTPFLLEKVVQISDQVVQISDRCFALLYVHPFICTPLKGSIGKGSTNNSTQNLSIFNNFRDLDVDRVQHCDTCISRRKLLQNIFSVPDCSRLIMVYKRLVYKSHY